MLTEAAAVTVHCDVPFVQMFANFFKFVGMLQDVEARWREWVTGTHDDQKLFSEYRLGCSAVLTSLNFLSLITKYTPPCCRAGYIWCVKQNRRSRYSNEQA